MASAVREGASPPPLRAMWPALWPFLRPYRARIGAAIVFLIDWNRARKRLVNFVDKEGAIAVLTAAAANEVGHMAWLKAGGERLVFSAMQAVGSGTFRIGDRLDEVLGETQARTFLLDVMRLSTQALMNGQPIALVADETRMLLARQVQRRTTEFDLLDEHAAYCQTLAQAVSDALAGELKAAVTEFKQSYR